MKKYFLLCVALLIIFASCIQAENEGDEESFVTDHPSQSEDEIENERDEMAVGTAGGKKLLEFVVTSDLHFTSHDVVSIYPMTEAVQELTDLFLEWVIRRRPNALIMCGDNTNSGREDDYHLLQQKLVRVREAGIPIILVPGNHDFGNGHGDLFDKYARELCDFESEDAGSMSFSVRMPGIRILSMDDCSQNKDYYGEFSEDSLRWLQSEAKEAGDSDEFLLFLSHHNVLPGGEDAVDSQYVIRNQNLRDLLPECGVRLCLSGHKHSQEIMRYGGLYEIVSATPLASPHYFGLLSLYEDIVEYHTMQLDFSGSISTMARGDAAGNSAGFDFGPVLEEEARKNHEMLETILSKADLSGFDLREKAAISRLFEEFMNAQNMGEIALKRDEIMGNPYYDDFIEAFSDLNYGPWMKQVLENTELPGNTLRISRH